MQVNQKVSKTAHIKELNQEIDRLKAELFCTREKNGVYMPAELFQQREQVGLLLSALLSILQNVCNPDIRGTGTEALHHSRRPV